MGIQKVGRDLIQGRQDVPGVDVDVSKRDPVGEAWKSFIGYMLSVVPQSGLGIATVSLLLNVKTPVAWKVGVELVSGNVDEDVTDVDGQWLSFARHVLAMTKNNNGFAIVETTVVTHNRRPSCWVQADMKLIYPMAIVSGWGPEVVARVLYPGYVRSQSGGY